jgi:excisionase family DNA binding protein
MLTTADVAEVLSVRPDHILALIASGRLVATNIARSGSSRPRWRIDPAELRRFLDSRTTQRASAPRRRKRCSEIVKEWV